MLSSANKSLCTLKARLLRYSGEANIISSAFSRSDCSSACNSSSSDTCRDTGERAVAEGGMLGDAGEMMTEDGSDECVPLTVLAALLCSLKVFVCLLESATYDDGRDRR